MATISILPASLTLRCFSGDEFKITLDFDVNLTGYTIESDIYRLGTPTVVDGQSITPTTSIDQFTISVLSTESGTIRISLTEEQTAALNGSYRFLLRWVPPGGVTRTVLNGVFEVTKDLTLASGTNSDGAVISVEAADAVPSGSQPSTFGPNFLLGELIWG